MAYVKTNWQNGVTPVNADNMNKIENELEALDQASGGGTVGFTINCSIDSASTVILYFEDGTNNTITNTNATFNNVVMFNITKISGGVIDCPVLYIDTENITYSNSFPPSTNKNYFVLGDGAISLSSGGSN